ncbi:MerR-like DNA binding protein [Bacillus oleivorans]|uniref:MerR-like DNA binding protein n=1 Tax=Bacillus oleivorans TaxID=1448271 RepID=A0A285CS90_9BACI|nr:anti-repressor SinI family protein [Bacillus oleivorans]SNX70364.1 MerR-like DNA binding protein [Bacillus oleivorans]
MEKGKVLHSVDSDHNSEQEWVQLILEAKSLGITLEEIQEFFKNKRITPENQ